MRRPRALDLFCKAGVVTKGLQRAGYYVVGVDIEPQPNYCGDEFIQADALTVDLGDYDLYCASPPCQFGSELTPSSHRANHPNLIPATRERLIATGKPYVIENVEGVRRHLINPIKLCGTMFGLPIWRHRYFEAPFLPLLLVPPCRHDFHPVVVSGQTNRRVNGKRPVVLTQTRRDAMGIDWMAKEELKQAIPPAYSEFLGRAVLAYTETCELSACGASSPA